MLSLKCFICILGAFSLCVASLWSQNPDSLELKISKTKGIDKAEALSDAIALFVRSDLHKAKRLVDQTYTLSKNSHDPLIESYSFLNHGLYLAATGKTDSAILMIKKGEPTARTNNNSNFLIRSGVALGRTYMSKGNPEQALTNLYSTLNILKTNPNPEIEMKIRVNITWAYLELKRYKDCVSFGNASLREMKPELEYMMPYICNNMAASYGAMGLIDSAQYLVKKGIPIAEHNKDYNLLANAYFILGNSYSEVGQYELAIEQFQKAKPYREKLGNQFFIVADLYVMSETYCKKGDYNNGIKYGLEALSIAEKNNIIMKFEGVYQSLAQNYEGLGDYKNSSKYYNLLAAAKDSVYQNATAVALADMQTKYETEKKEQQIVLLNSANELKEATIERNYFFMGGLIALIGLIILGFYVRHYREKQKQQVVLQEQKVRLREAQVNAVIDSQEKERKRFASDLHDGMGQLISALQLSINTIRQNHSTETRDQLLENSEQILSDVHNEIRNIAFNLMPPVLIKEGLIPGLHELIRRINQAGVFKIKLSDHGINKRFSEVGEISLYRIVQEFISNIVKHSNARQVTLDFTGHDDEIILTIEDDGMGYSLDKFQNSEGNGWRNINSRLNLIKASIDFDVIEGRKNNTVIITVPSSAIKAQPVQLDQEGVTKNL